MPAPVSSLLERLLREPGRFSFDAAFELLLAAVPGRRPEEALRFEVPAGLRPALRDVLAVRAEPTASGERFTLRLGFSGLTGPGGVLPRVYTETVNEEQRHRSPALAAFLDLLAQRFLMQFALAGAKYHPHRVATLARATTPYGATPPDDPFVASLLALTGHGLPGDVSRSGLGPGQILYFAGLFASRPRSADRLSALLTEWLGVPVRIEQFVGTWQTLAPDDRTRLGAEHAGLGRDAAAGVRVWDIQSRIRIVLGPLDYPTFETLLPGQPRLRALDRVIRAYLDDEAGFAINPILRADAVPPARTRIARLGQTAWLPTNAPRKRNATETLYTEAVTGRP